VGLRGCMVIVTGMSSGYSGVGCNSGVHVGNGFVVRDSRLAVLRGCCVAVSSWPDAEAGSWVNPIAKPTAPARTNA